jgi:hypothetical protein
VTPPSGEIGFWYGFSIFFPAVTGVMAGLGLSGDLSNPAKSIPRGAILAVLTGLLIYLMIPVLLSIGTTADELQTNKMIWASIAPLGRWIIFPGLWGAIFSSAVGSMLGAPRTLQALSLDGIAPKQFGGKSGASEKLLVPLILSIAIALGAVFLGTLDAVANIVTMFFLTTYGIINFTAAFETLSGDPSWRPKLRVPWFISILGGFGCTFVIFLINPLAGIIAILAEILLWKYLTQKKQASGWGDARRGFYESVIRWALILLSRRPMSARNWRPHLLVFVSDLLSHLNLVRFGNWFSQDRGVVTVCELKVGDLLTEEQDMMERRIEMKKVLEDEGLVVFPEMHIVKDIVEGITNVAQANGMAGIESNMILLGWPKDTKLLSEFLRIMRRLEKLNKSFAIGRIGPDISPHYHGKNRTIHIWWGGLERNGDMMLLLAYLLSRNPDWLRAKIKIMSIASNELMKQETERYLEKLIPEIRIEAETRIIIKPKRVIIRDLIHKESRDADVVLFGLAMPKIGEEEAYAERLEELAHDLKTVFFVKNSSLFIGELVKPTNEK